MSDLVCSFQQHVWQYLLTNAKAFCTAMHVLSSLLLRLCLVLLKDTACCLSLEFLHLSVARINMYTGDVLISICVAGCVQLAAQPQRRRAAALICHQIK